MKNLRTRMIVIVFISAALIFAMTFFLVRGSFIYYYNRQADAMTMLISSYNGEVPELSEYNEEEFSDDAQGYNAYISISEESAFSTRYFVVNLDENYEIASSNLEHVASVDETLAAQMAEYVLSLDSSTGYMDYFRFRVVENDSGTVSIIFLDCTEDYTFRKAITTITGIISIIFPLLITLVFGFLSKKVMEPFEENTRRQKQFITDAGHELKTPLAIISANASVLEYKTGENEWISNITDQTAHMSDLIDDLLTLSRMEEYDVKTDTEPVDFTEIINQDIDDFAPVFEQKGVRVSSQITGDVILSGNRKQIAMLVSILIENASKYVKEGGEVKITLVRKSKNAVFEIYNTADIDENLDVNRLFARFYRADSSRNSKTGGQGIGLSTALRIVRLHSGTINAKKKEGGISFTVSLPVKKTS